MSLCSIEARFECDGCGEPFIVEMDPAHHVTGNRSLYDEATSACEWGKFLRYPHKPRRGQESATFCSVLPGIGHLCPKCTRTKDQDDTTNRLAIP